MSTETRQQGINQLTDHYPSERNTPMKNSCRLRTGWKLLCSVSLLTALPLFLFAQTARWTSDKNHTSVKFEVQHLGVAIVAGQFLTFEGSMLSEKKDFTDASINFTVQTGSVNTNVEMRDKDLRSDNFLDVTKYPEMVFKSHAFTIDTDGSYTLSGDLTIKDVTKPVKFHVTYHKTITDPWGDTRTGFRAEVTINRFDYHINYAQKFDNGALHVAPDVKIILDTELTRSK
jgi:polyisoprenoid-binding protein YceI